MTIIEMRTMETICSNLPRISSMLGRIANEMKRIADELFFANQFAMNKACERKEVEDDNT